jgi:galactokinase
MSERISAFAPGRVNLIGDHTDHTGGLCLPMAVSMGITVEGQVGGAEVVLTSDGEPVDARVPIDVTDPSVAEPAWARYVAGVVSEIRPPRGLVGTVRSDLPAGAGLSSSAALEVAVALAIGFDGSDLELAQRCQRAEQRATGVPCGILDQLASVGGVAGHALVMDCDRLTLRPVPMPDHVEIVVVHSGQERRLADSAYAERRAECEAAQAEVGPLRIATLVDVGRIDDGVLRRRARHVVTENQRVRDAAAALEAGDAAALGELFVESHRSLRDDFECSTPVVDATVERLCATAGVHGARMTGGGWGGCVVAVTEPGALSEGWIVRPGPGAHRR